MLLAWECLVRLICTVIYILLVFKRSYCHGNEQVWHIATSNEFLLSLGLDGIMAGPSPMLALHSVSPPHHHTTDTPSSTSSSLSLWYTITAVTISSVVCNVFIAHGCSCLCSAHPAMAGPSPLLALHAVSPPHHHTTDTPSSLTQFPYPTSQPCPISFRFVSVVTTLHHQPKPRPQETSTLLLILVLDEGRTQGLVLS